MKHRQQGFNLIEVMVAALLLSVGMVGLVSIQARATQLAVGVEDSQRATLLVQELAAEMWGQGTVNLDAARIEAWQARVADARVSGLPRGEGSVTLNGTRAHIEVQWRPPGRAEGVPHRYFSELELR